MGGTMRLGEHEVLIREGTTAHRIYGFHVLTLGHGPEFAGK
jgi:CTP synthase (UTP-ammonia lyase)